MRYNPLTDYVEVLHAGTWKNFLLAGFDWDGLFFNYGNLCSVTTGGWTSGGSGGNISFGANAIVFGIGWDYIDTNIYAITKSAIKIPKRFTRVRALYDVIKTTDSLRCSITIQICSESGSVLDQKTVGISDNVSNQTIEIQLAPSSNVYNTPVKIKVISISTGAASEMYFSYTMNIYRVWAVAE